jgi:hypothetical protein
VASQDPEEEVKLSRARGTLAALALLLRVPALLASHFRIEQHCT